jgi:hypothetical protein
MASASPNMNYERKTSLKKSQLKGNNEQILNIVEKLVDKINDTSLNTSPKDNNKQVRFSEEKNFSDSPGNNKSKNLAGKICNYCGQQWHESGQVCPARGKRFN